MPRCIFWFPCKILERDLSSKQLTGCHMDRIFGHSPLYHEGYITINTRIM
ncbi:hypothetical protein ACU8KH_05009 [Lachancea thermotolerans]